MASTSQAGYTQPGIPRGTRDFGPTQMAQRTYVLEVIRKYFTRFGFQQLETPAMENLAVLTGKYGEEGDRLIYKILNSGNFLDGVNYAELAINPPALAAQICDRALRYDLTVPFARYIAMNAGKLTFPFRRYQMQPVWRADRPQKGRYREFWQCDADIIGTESLICEGELVSLLWQAFSELGLSGIEIRVNSRKLLSAMAERLEGGADGQNRLQDFTQAIDKLDKIGREGVEKELRERGFSDSTITGMGPLFESQEKKATGYDALPGILRWLSGTAGVLSENGKLAEKELLEVAHYAQTLGVPSNALVFVPTLARGLSYYTGCIFEVVTLETEMGSISGGGRYDNLTGIFGLEGMSGVGVSFGIDRICDVLETLNRYPATLKATSTTILLHALDGDGLNVAVNQLAMLRHNHIAAEIYPEPGKPKRALSYADKLGIGFVGLFGSEEIAKESLSIKDMVAGTQELVPFADVAAFIKEKVRL
jgi:histidyl-tRNA synthetase